MHEGKLLEQYLKDNRITKAELARMVGTSPQNVGYHLKREKIDDSFKYKLKEAKVNIFDKDKVGNDSMTTIIKDSDKNHGTKGQKGKFNDPAVTLNIKNLMLVPLVNQYAYAGYLSGYGDPVYMEELPRIPFIVDKEYKGNYMCFEIRGDSMDDGSKSSYSDRDTVLCREISKDHWKSPLHIQKWDFMIVHEDGPVLKKIISHNVDTGDIVCHSLNPLYDDFTINLNEVSQLFNVIRHVRNP